MIWVCHTCKSIIKTPIEEITVVTGPNGAYYHARCVIGQYVEGKFVVVDTSRGKMDARPEESGVKL